MRLVMLYNPIQNDCTIAFSLSSGKLMPSYRKARTQDTGLQESKQAPVRPTRPRHVCIGGTVEDPTHALADIGPEYCWMQSGYCLSLKAAMSRQLDRIRQLYEIVKIMQLLCCAGVEEQSRWWGSALKFGISERTASVGSGYGQCRKSTCSTRRAFKLQGFNFW